MTDTFHVYRAVILRELGSAPDDAGFYRLFWLQPQTHINETPEASHG